MTTVRIAVVCCIVVSGLVALACGSDGGRAAPPGEDAGPGSDANGNGGSGGGSGGNPDAGGGNPDAGGGDGGGSGRGGGDANAPDASPDSPSEGDASGPDAGPDATNDGAMPATGNVLGQVLLTNGKSLGNVTVEVGGMQVQTDNRGVFEMEVSVGDVNVFLRDEDHSTGHAKVIAQSGATVSMRLKTMKLTKIDVADIATGGVVTGADGFQVELPANAFKNPAGDAATGAAELRYALLNSSEVIGAAPGGMMASVGGDPVELESFGMVDVKFMQGDEKLTFEGQATIRLPLGPNAFSEGETVGLFSFDEDQGIWVQEGIGTVTSGQFVADVDHFSWWNCDQPLSDQSAIEGTLIDIAGNPVAGTRIDVTGLDYLTSLGTTTGDDGTFCVRVKRGSQNRLSAFTVADGLYQHWTEDVTASTVASQCGDAEALDIGTVSLEKLFSDCPDPTVGDLNSVYVTSSGDSVLDAAVQTALEGYGQTVTLGVPYTAFDATVDLSGHDAIYLQTNSNWNTGDMPLDGQLELIDWVNCGGGLVASEWILWKAAAQSGFVLVNGLFPAEPTSAFTSSGVDIEYVRVTADSTINAGLPASFTFIADSFSGTETDMIGRSGSTVYYDSTNLGSGVVGWDFNHGRVINISTVAGSGQIADASYSRMLSNLIDWVRRD